jgi:putative sigma-54 modulation protein
MQVHITARHLELTPALADYVQKRVERVARHFRAVLRVQAILSVEKLRHTAEVVVHADGRHEFRAQAVSADLYAAIDGVVEKLHIHMARHKDRRVRGRRGEKVSPAPVVSAPAGRREPVPGEPALSRISRVTPRSLSVAQAARELSAQDFEFLLFTNPDTSALNILYRRRDHSFGLLEPVV